MPCFWWNNGHGKKSGMVKNGKLAFSIAVERAWSFIF